MKKKLIAIFLILILIPAVSYAADETVAEQTALGAQPATDDSFLVWDTSTGLQKKVTYSNMVDIKNADSYGGLTAAVAAISTTVTTIICNSAQTITDDLSVPTTLTLICTQECSLNPANTKTLTVNSTPIAGDYSITGGDGTVTFAGSGIVFASWTGGTAGAIVLGNLQSGRNGTDGSLTVYSEQGGTDYTFSFNPHATMTESTAYLMPAADGAADEFLKTDGSLQLSWGAASGGASILQSQVFN